MCKVWHLYKTHHIIFTVHVHIGKLRRWWWWCYSPQSWPMGVFLSVTPLDYFDDQILIFFARRQTITSHVFDKEGRLFFNKSQSISSRLSNNQNFHRTISKHLSADQCWQFFLESWTISRRVCDDQNRHSNLKQWSFPISYHVVFLPKSKKGWAQCCVVKGTIENWASTT